MADRRMARGTARADRLLALRLAGRHRARATRAPGQAALEDRTRLQATQGRAWPRPLRRPLVAGLAPPHGVGHRRPRLSHTRAAEPFSPARTDVPEGRAAAAADLQML